MPMEVDELERELSGQTRIWTHQPL
jgi:hypothetical protein